MQRYKKAKTIQNKLLIYCWTEEDEVSKSNFDVVKFTNKCVKNEKN